MSEYTYIDNKSDLIAFADRHGLRRDWHEPDEQGVSARVVGTILDNAFGARGHDRSNRIALEPASSFTNLFTGHELRVVLEAEGPEGETENYVVNLAYLFAWAAEDRISDIIAPIGDLR